MTNTSTSLSHPAPATASPAQQRILERLWARGGSATAAELAEELNLHLTTVRFHLDHLCASGLVDSVSRKGSTRGRPRLHYFVTDHVPDPTTAGLLDVLAAAVAENPDALDTAIEAGRRWADTVPLSPGPPAEVLRMTAAHMGFAPRQGPPPGDADVETSLDLTSCPFRESARRSPDVVCRLHEVLFQSVLDRSLAGTCDSTSERGGDADTARTTTAHTVEVLPFVGESLCRIVLHASAHGDRPCARSRES